MTDLDTMKLQGAPSFAARCRPAIKEYANRAAQAVLKIGTTYPEHYRGVLEADAKRAADLLDEIDALLASPAASPFAEALRKSETMARFLDAGFWDANHVDLVWRHNGRDVRERADWLKDIWYLVARGGYL